MRSAGALRSRRRRDLRGHARRRAARPRARGRARHDPVQVVPGHACARPGVPLAAARPDESDGRADRPRDRDEVPLVLRPPSRTSASGCCTSSGRPTSWTEPIWASSAKNLEDRALRRSVQRLDRIALGEAKRLFATSRNVADADRALDRARRRGDAAIRRRQLPYRCDEYGDFVLSVNRLDRAKRIDLLLEAAALDPALRVVVTGDGPDRERLEALARERGPERPRRVHGPRSTRPSSRRSTPAASPSTTRRSTRTSGWSRTRRSCPRSPW